MLLLEDSVCNIANYCRDHPEKMNWDILEEWINSKGKQPMTWVTLVDILQDTGLTNLANEITAVNWKEASVQLVLQLHGTRNSMDRYCSGIVISS